MSENYLDHLGKDISVDDRINYASKGEISVGRVLELLPNEKGIKVIGVGKRREATLVHPEKQVIVTHKGYFKNHKRAKRTGKA